MHRNPTLIALGLALAMSSAAVSAAGLRDLKVLEDDTGTRAVFDIEGAAPYKMFSLHNPERLVLDLSGTQLAKGFRLPPPNGAVANVRTGKPVADTLRVVFELGKTMSMRSRVEQAGADTRLIVELSSPDKMASASVLPETSPVPLAVAAAPTAISPPAAVKVPAMDKTTDNESAASPSPIDAFIANGANIAQAAPAPAKTVQDVIGKNQRELIVAIDAGHGGKDPGAHGPTGVHEKMVTLAVARELAAQIDADPGMKAVLIRDNDTFVPLQDRYMRARAAQADLFISIHADASPNHSASGASVFVLSTRGASSQAARWLADQENAADLVGGVSLDQKDHNLAAVLLDLSQSATMRASDDVANQVLGSLKNVGKAHKPAVERANFVVLRSPDVPSMLIETGFITNPSEEKRLNDPEYRNRLATAIAEGVRMYFIDQPPAGTWFAAQRDLKPASRQHVVSRGETLSLIAARHGVGVDSIREANRRHSDTVRVGERLTIPLMASAPK